MPDVFVLRDGFRRFGAFAKGGYQGRDLVLLSAEKRIPYTGGDPSGGTRLLNELAADTTEDSPYLFPFLEGMKTGEDAYKEYNTVLGGFNRRLKILSESIGIHTRVTSYTIRHSFATTLKEQNVPIEMISELLGHKSIKTTQIYLKSFSLEKLSTVNKLCFESVYNYAPKVG